MLADRIGCANHFTTENCSSTIMADCNKMANAQFVGRAWNKCITNGSGVWHQSSTSRIHVCERVTLVADQRRSQTQSHYTYRIHIPIEPIQIGCLPSFVLRLRRCYIVCVSGRLLCSVAVDSVFGFSAFVFSGHILWPKVDYRMNNASCRAIANVYDFGVAKSNRADTHAQSRRPHCDRVERQNMADRHKNDGIECHV